MADEVKYKAADDLKISVTLFSGKVVVIDMMKITMSEWKTALKTSTPEEEEHKIIAKVTGMKVEELAKLLQPEYRLIIDGFFRAGTQPLTNPT